MYNFNNNHKEMNHNHIRMRRKVLCAQNASSIPAGVCYNYIPILVVDKGTP